jgi:hypothetical protein
MIADYDALRGGELGSDRQPFVFPDVIYLISFIGIHC